MTPRPLALLAASLCLAAAAQAALPVGASAPDFSADAALAGQPYKFKLAEALKQGPVVVFFYPKAFTSGCTVEAHQFSEATEKFKALSTTVIGLSNDNIETLKKFSVEACRGKFAVGADAGGKVMRDYDAKLAMFEMADRISYLVGTDGKIAAVHSSMNPDGHIEAMLKGAERLSKK